MTLVVKLQVTGMTCGSCVQSIESTIGDRSDVTSVVVSLDAETATIRYDATATSPAALCEAIDDMAVSYTHLTLPTKA